MAQGLGRTVYAVIVMMLAASLGACTGVNNASGTATTYSDPGTAPPPPQGLGIQSQDIVSMTDEMMRDMLAEPRISRQTKAPRVIVDSEFFYDETREGAGGHARLNKNTITDRLRVSLGRAAHGRMVFVGRHHAGMVEQERKLKSEKVTDQGTRGRTEATLGADFRLGGRITSLEGRAARYTQIVFEMIDLETSEVVWSGMYEFNKTAFNANTAGDIDVDDVRKSR